MKSFGSDNHSGIHPDILQALAESNDGHQPAYGDDIHTRSVENTVREMFGGECVPLVVFSGTGANVLALRSMARPYEAIVCAQTAHINENEVGAPECHTGCKLITIPTQHGKLTPEAVEQRIGFFTGQHRSIPLVISITQPTELGTVYTTQEIAALADYAHGRGMYLHVDGARLANALAATGATPREMITDTGVDSLSLGGTKNGMACGEIVVFLKPELAVGAHNSRKQLLQLASKMRFVSAQFEAYFRNDLWLRTAGHANRMAAYMAERLARVPGTEIAHPVEANAVFCVLDRCVAGRLREKYPFNVSGDDPCTARWMCSFDTEREDIDKFVGALVEAID